MKRTLCSVLVSALLTTVLGADDTYIATKDNSWLIGKSLLNGYTSLSQVSLSDDSYVKLNLPWPFRFYGETYTSFYLNSNGLLMFETPSTSSSVNGDNDGKDGNAGIPTDQVPPEDLEFMPQPADTSDSGDGEIKASAHKDEAAAVAAEEKVMIVIMKRELKKTHMQALTSHVRSQNGKAAFMAHVLDEFEHLRMFTVKAPSASALEFLKNHPDVLEVHEDRIVRANPIIPQANSPYAWGLDRIDQADTPLDSANYVPPAYTNSGLNVDVYVLDTGLDTTHAEFQGNPSRTVSNVFASYSTVKANNDGNGHGTHVAGTVGGKNVGVAPNANIYGVKVLSDGGSGSTSAIVNGMNYVLGRRNANPTRPIIVSMSLGGSCGSFCSTDGMVLAVKDLTDNGVSVVVAAGNENTDACTTTPAAAASAITVGATTISDDLASYSNYGSCVDILAPGSSIKSACSLTSSMACDSSDPTYLTISGTSMATPHVSGVVALWLSMTAASYTSSPPSTDSIVLALQCESEKNTISAFNPVANLFLQSPADFDSFAEAACDLNAACDNVDCGDHGTCVFGSCSCDAGFGGTLCDVETWYSNSFCCNGASLSDSSSPPFHSIAMLWTDLNPGISGSKVYYGSVDSDTYAVVFNNVPAYGFSTCTVTFELLLHSNGDIDMAFVNNKIANSCAKTKYVSVGIKGPSVDGPVVQYIQLYGPALSNIPTNFHYYLQHVPGAGTPTLAPVIKPTAAPIVAPTRSPTRTPSFSPTRLPTNAPTRLPTKAPVFAPTRTPTIAKVVTPKPSKAKKTKKSI